jgi:hypothetical protein
MAQGAEAVGVGLSLHQRLAYVLQKRFIEPPNRLAAGKGSRAHPAIHHQCRQAQKGAAPHEVHPKLGLHDRHRARANLGERGHAEAQHVDGKVDEMVHEPGLAGLFVGGAPAAAGGHAQHDFVLGPLLLQLAQNGQRGHHLAHRDGMNPDALLSFTRRDGGAARALAPIHRLLAPAGAQKHPGNPDRGQKDEEDVVEPKNHCGGPVRRSKAS